MPSKLALLPLVLLLAIPASAELWAFDASFSVTGLGDPSPVGTAQGIATVNSSGGGAHLASLQLPGGLFSIQSSTTPDLTTFTKLIVSLTPGAGSFAGGSGTGTLSGVLPVPGNVRLCLIGDCAFALDIPFTENGTRGVGIGGTLSQTVLGTGTLSIVGAPWRDVTATVNGTTGPVTTVGFAHGPASLTSSTVQAGGVVQMVTPVQLGFSTGGQPPLPLPMFGVMRVEFLPEPGPFAGLVAGALALAAVGWRRRR